MTGERVSLKTGGYENLGRGIFTFANGDIYDGEWKDDKMSGKFIGGVIESIFRQRSP